MYIFANLLLVASFICALTIVVGLSIPLAFNPGSLAGISPVTRAVRFAERGNQLICALMTISSLFLLYAFITYDFRLEYVADYSSLNLVLFYRMTAFWGGKEGSVLFWAWAVAISGLFFPYTAAYKQLSSVTQGWYWCFFLSIIGFFLFLLVTWSDPFVMLPNPPKDGRGLNPLLQNPGMIFHPPLLFLGYGGFVIPGCLALGQTMHSIMLARAGSPSSQNILPDEPHWGLASRPFTLVGWAMLTAGIILGAWWAYMELGWGGYWAWDPVENASLIPWLVGTAYLHTSVIESRRGKLARTNVFFINLTTISAFFASYLVRSDVVQSLHAFGAGGASLLLLAFVLLYLALVFCICFFAPATSKPLDSLFSREGLLLLVTWILVALAVIILLGTLWAALTEFLIANKSILPAFLASKLPSQSVGLTAQFYNRVCLPFFAALGALLLLCPHLRWDKKLMDRRILAFTFIGVASLTPALWFSGVQNYLALAAISSAFAALVGLVMLFAALPGLFRATNTVLAHGVHMGLLLIIVGIGFSGPYQETNEFILSKGQSATAGAYTFTVDEVYRGNSRLSSQGVPYYSFYETQVSAYKNGVFVGKLNPQIRKYAGYENNSFLEVSTIFSLKDEIYATFMGVSNRNEAQLSISINPLVNWIWIGATLMTLFPFLVFMVKRRTEQTPDSKE